MNKQWLLLSSLFMTLGSTALGMENNTTAEASSPEQEITAPPRKENPTQPVKAKYTPEQIAQVKKQGSWERRLIKHAFDPRMMESSQ